MEPLNVKVTISEEIVKNAILAMANVVKTTQKETPEYELAAITLLALCEFAEKHQAKSQIEKMLSHKQEIVN